MQKEQDMYIFLLLTFLSGIGAGMGLAIHFTARMKITKSTLPFLIAGIVFFLMGIVLVGLHP